MSQPEDSKRSGLVRTAIQAVAIMVGVLLLNALAGYIHYARWVDAPIESIEGPVEVTIEPGGFDSSVRTLERSGLVRFPTYFKILAAIEKKTGHIKAGTYEIPAGTTPRELLETLTAGSKGPSVRVTVPEGWTIYHIADRVAELGLADRDAFVSACADPELRRRLGIEAPTVEGHLFPDTYDFRPDTPPARIIERMVRQHRRVWAEVVEDKGAQKVEKFKATHDLSQQDLLVLASIVEREAVVADEQPVIARVLLNRLAIDMKLQVDPTCIYGPKIYQEKPRPDLCRDDKSRYSTYVIEGLPPTPIANPGRSALAAVLSPAKNEYLYFVARSDGSGRHTFSKTYEEHKKAVGN